jgi:hypothetical protein
VAAHLAEALVMRVHTHVARKLATYAFMVIVGLLGGRMVAAAYMFQQFGWTATWIEISRWGHRDTPEPSRNLLLSVPTRGKLLSLRRPHPDTRHALRRS